MRWARCSGYFAGPRCHAANSPTTAGKGRIASCSKRFVLTTKRVSPVRMRRPSVDNTASWFCSKSGNRSSPEQMGKFNDHAAEETSSQLRLLRHLFPGSAVSRRVHGVQCSVPRQARRQRKLLALGGTERQIGAPPCTGPEIRLRHFFGVMTARGHGSCHLRG